MTPQRHNMEAESPKRPRSSPTSRNFSPQRMKLEHQETHSGQEASSRKQEIDNDNEGKGKARRRLEHSSDADSISGYNLATLSLDNDADTRSIGSGFLKKKKKVVGSNRKRTGRRQLKPLFRNKYQQSFQNVIKPKSNELSHVRKRMAQAWKSLNNTSSEGSAQDESGDLQVTKGKGTIFHDDSESSSDNYDHSSQESNHTTAAKNGDNLHENKNGKKETIVLDDQETKETIVLDDQEEPQHTPSEDNQVKVSNAKVPQQENLESEGEQEGETQDSQNNDSEQPHTTMDTSNNVTNEEHRLNKPPGKIQDRNKPRDTSTTVTTASTTPLSTTESNPGIITLNGRDQYTDEEDEINTQGSQDTIMGPPPSNLPPWFRFRIIVNMPKLPDDIVAKKLKGEEIPQEYKNNDLRLLNVIKKFFAHVKDFDQAAMIMEWSSQNDNNELQAILDPAVIPSAPSETKKFVYGFKGKQTGPVYVKLRIATTFSHQDFTLNCKSWMQENECSITRCPIQAENAEEIGWLSYSSQFNDKDYIAAQLELAAGHEVGLRLAAIANKAESKLDWKKKSRGLIVVVPTEKAVATKKLFTNLFKSRKETNYENPNPILDLFHTFSFLPLEHELTKMPNCKANYAICLHRHQIHYKSIKAKFTTSILIDIDKKLSTRVGRLSLQEMIMNIKSTNDKLNGANLFHSVDFTEDNSTVYLPYEKHLGRGESGYLFQFYQCLEEEAIAMFQGLGIYLEAKYGIPNLESVFGVNHWAENAQWKWDDENNKFITPEELLVQDLIHLDANAALLSIEEKNIEEEETEANITAASRIMTNQQQRLIELLNNPDLDPITTLDTPVQHIVDEVVLDTSMPSAASSITDQHSSNIETSSQCTRRKDNTTISNESQSSTGSFGTKTMRGILDPRLSAAENRQRLAAATTHKLNRLKQQQERLDAELAEAEAKEDAKEKDASEDFDNLVSYTTHENHNNHQSYSSLKPPASSDMAGPKT